MDTAPAETTFAVIYARQSEDVAVGIGRQRERCTKLIQARGWEVAGEYVDNDTSATKKRGPGTAWAKMLADLKGYGSTAVVVAVDLDRLLRTLADLVAITDTGARVLTVNGDIDLTTADGEFRATMLAGISRFEVRRKGERQQRANESRAASGLPIPGRRRYGYESDGITPREPEATEVRRMFRHVADGGSIRALRLDLIAREVDPAPGRAWHPNRIRGILNNPHYSGHVRHLGVATPSPFIVPIVPEELAASVRAILADPSRRTTPGPKPRHLLSGLATCSRCGANMFYMRGYRCKADASHPYILKDRLEPIVLDEVARAFITGGAELFPASAGGSAISDLIARHGRNAVAVKATMEDRDEGLVPASTARARLLELRAEREDIEAALDRERTAKSSAGALLEIAQSLIVPGQWSDYDDMKATVLARFAELDIDRQREVVRALLYIEVAPGRDRSRVKIWHKLAVHLNPDTEPGAITT